MKRRLLSILLLCSMVLTTLPATAFAEEGQDAPVAETPVCSCETACTEEGMNADCPICGAEGAALGACQKYVPAAEAAEAEPEPEAELPETIDCKIYDWDENKIITYKSMREE